MGELRIGIAGAGLIGSVHAAALQQIAAALGPGRLRLVAVADPCQEARERAVRNFGFQNAHPDAEVLLRDAEINVLYICTPTRLHAEIFQGAVERGLHVFCEKPVGMSAAEGEAMARAAQAAGVHTQVGLVLRFSPVYCWIREWLRRPEIGPLMGVLLRDDQCLPIRGVHSSPWRKDRAWTAGGTMIEHGVHDIDLLQWLFGPIRWLQAWERNLAGYPGIEDYVAVELEFSSGLHAQVLNVWHDMVQRPSNRRLEVFCRRGFAASDHDMLGPVRQQIGDGPEEEIPPPAVLQAFVRQLGRADDPLSEWFGIPYFVEDLLFVEALLAGRPPAPDIWDGVRAQHAVEAIYWSATSGAPVELDRFPMTRSAG